MTTDFVHATVRRSNRKQMFLCGAGALLLLILAALNTRYFYNFALGPAPIDRATLLATSDPGTLQRYWVTLEGDEAIDTGFQEVERNTKTGSERVTASYMALLLDRRILVVKAQDDAKATKFTGYLEPLPSDVGSKIIADAENETPELKGAFLPYMLNTDNFRTNGYIALAIGIPLFCLLIFGFMRALLRSNNPLTHPILRGLSRFGQPAEVVGQLDSELMLQHPTVGKLHLTPNWLVQATSTTLSATRIDDVVWAYKRVTQHRTNGIPTGKTYAAHIWDRHGVCLAVDGKEAVVDQVLTAAVQRAPWMLAGFSTDLEKAWKSNRGSVLAAVDQRRQQVAMQMR